MFNIHTAITVLSFFVFITVHYYIVFHELQYFCISLVHISPLYVIVFVSLEYFIVFYHLKLYRRAIAQLCSQRRKTHSLTHSMFAPISMLVCEMVPLCAHYS